MNVTPATVARSIRSAQEARAERERVAGFGSVLAFTTSTGDAPRVYREPSPVVAIEEDDAHCFVCGRHTNHFAEHDDMVEAGTARYGDDGSVYPVPWKWDVE